MKCSNMKSCLSIVNIYSHILMLVIKRDPIYQAERFETSLKEVYSNHLIGNVNQTLDGHSKLNKTFVCHVRLDSYIV